MYSYSASASKNLAQTTGIAISSSEPVQLRSAMTKRSQNNRQLRGFKGSLKGNKRNYLAKGWFMLLTCPIPGPQYFASVICFGSPGPGRKECSSGLGHRNQLTAKAWEKDVQELGKLLTTKITGCGNDFSATSLQHKIRPKIGFQTSRGKCYCEIAAKYERETQRKL